MRIKLHNDGTLEEWSVLWVKAIMELLKVCLRATYIEVDDKFIRQTDSIDEKSSLPLCTNIYMEHFEKLALDSA
jgi:hypothetical protein